MNAYRLLRIVVACGVLAAWTLAISGAEAQTRREMRRGTARVQVQPVPVPVQPAPLAAQPTPAADPAAAAKVERVEAARAPSGKEARLIRGRALIGMSIWGPNQERLGVVKDFIVDYEGQCPTLFVAMAPEITGWSEGYVVVPLDAFQTGYDERQRTEYFVLSITVENLRRAPHLEIDRWNSLRDRQFFTSARQFFRPTERTSARRDLDADRDVSPGNAPAAPQTPSPRKPVAPREEQTSPPSEKKRETPARPHAESPSGEKHGAAGRESGADRQPRVPSPTADSPKPTPPKPVLGPAKKESIPAKEP